VPRAVLVAGGTGALGAAVLRELLDSGYPVTATWIVDEERERAEAELAGASGLSLVRADLMDPDDAAAAVASVDDLGAVVDLVGGFFDGPRVHETEVEDWDRLLRLNLRPAILLARAAMPVLLAAGGGSFLAVSARTALRPYRGAAAYSTSKAAVLAFVRALDADYAKDGVRSNAILPSVIDTPANRRATPDADFSRWVDPAEIAKVVRFLVSDDSAPTSGAAIPVYGRA
jgi:NAD(P)-dependent dehydrogenase (short-subunit alcohol dehydrogenase family)